MSNKLQRDVGQRRWPAFKRCCCWGACSASSCKESRSLCYTLLQRSQYGFYYCAYTCMHLLLLLLLRCTCNMNFIISFDETAAAAGLSWQYRSAHFISASVVAQLCCCPYYLHKFSGAKCSIDCNAYGQVQRQPQELHQPASQPNNERSIHKLLLLLHCIAGALAFSPAAAAAHYRHILPAPHCHSAHLKFIISLLAFCHPHSHLLLAPLPHALACTRMHVCVCVYSCCHIRSIVAVELSFLFFTVLFDFQFASFQPSRQPARQRASEHIASYTHSDTGSLWHL